MGRKGGKKFIEKGEGTKFYVMHRSQTDGAYANNERPSDFVLVAADTNGRRSDAQFDTFSDLLKKKESDEIKDHIDKLGFRNDGYDYQQHLKEMGGGQFVAASGKLSVLPTQRLLELPDDVLPSATELDRALQTITIDPNVMDSDLKAALFGEEDEEGEFEELDDEFVVECMQDPVVPDFDFDSHIANLIAISERMNDDHVGARGWEGSDSRRIKGKSYIGQTGLKFANEVLEEDNEDDDSGEFDSNIGDEINENGGRGETILDEQFEKMLEEYGSDDMGDLEEEV